VGGRNRNTCPAAKKGINLGGEGTLKGGLNLGWTKREERGVLLGGAGCRGRGGKGGGFPRGALWGGGGERRHTLRNQWWGEKIIGKYSQRTSSDLFALGKKHFEKRPRKGLGQKGHS